jgi:hypothetical protein
MGCAYIRVEFTYTGIRVAEITNGAVILTGSFAAVISTSAAMKNSKRKTYEYKSTE